VSCVPAKQARAAVGQAVWGNATSSVLT
jgi:hypothetical protein